MKRFLVCAMCVLTLAVSCRNNKKQNNMKEETFGPKYEIMTTKGPIVIALYNNTPLHRDNFARLVEEHFYDGLLFHRVIDGFMIQGGDPLSRDITAINAWGTGGPGYTVEAEFREGNTHKKGALAAARKGDMANPKKASSGSQFYIVQDEEGCRHLDGQYTVYGQTIDGFDVIDEIASVPTDYKNVPLEEIKIISITEIKDTLAR